MKLIIKFIDSNPFKFIKPFLPKSCRKLINKISEDYRYSLVGTMRVNGSGRIFSMNPTFKFILNLPQDCIKLSEQQLIELINLELLSSHYFSANIENISTQRGLEIQDLVKLRNRKQDFQLIIKPLYSEEGRVNGRIYQISRLVESRHRIYHVIAKMTRLA